MPDNLSKIFKDNLYPKKKDRNWERCADKYGDELVGEIMEMFPHAEQALCAVVHAMGSVVMQAKKEQRAALIDLLAASVKDRVAFFEEDEDDGPGDEDDEDELENEDDVDFAHDIPERPSPEPSEDGDDDGMDDEDPNESFLNNKSPARQAGFQPKRRPEGR